MGAFSICLGNHEILTFNCQLLGEADSIRSILLCRVRCFYIQDPHGWIWLLFSFFFLEKDLFRNELKKNDREFNFLRH